MRRLCLLLALTLAACSEGTEHPQLMPDAPRLLALGDSYTIGEGVTPAERWPAEVARRLRESGVDVADPVVVAQTGWTTDELDEGIDAADPAGPFGVVTLLVGVNNQYRGQGLEPYRSGFRDLLGRAIALAGGVPGRVVVVSIPDWGATPFGARDPRGPEQIAREVDAFNAVAREEAERAGAQWVDVTALSRTQGDAVVDDGLHPSAAAYAAWAEQIAPAVRLALSR